MPLRTLKLNLKSSVLMKQIRLSNDNKQIHVYLQLKLKGANLHISIYHILARFIYKQAGKNHTISFQSLEVSCILKLHNNT